MPTLGGWTTKSRKLRYGQEPALGLQTSAFSFRILGVVLHVLFSLLIRPITDSELTSCGVLYF